MTKDKQIEKMAKIIARRSKYFRNPNVAFMTTAEQTAESLYKAGYRKTSEVAEEIFAVVDSMLSLVCEMTGIDIRVYGRYAELKKKYIGKDTNVTTNTEEK